MKRRKIDGELIIKKTVELVRNCNSDLPQDVIDEISSYVKTSDNEQEQMLLDVILENAKIAEKKKLPLCQDTGMSIFFVEIGNVDIDGDKNIYELLNESVRLVYSEKNLRPSMLDDPLDGKNTCDNTPAFIHIEHTNSDNIRISYLAKGGGSENASATAMLNPSDGFNGVKAFVLGLVKEKGPNACPPLIIGVGIGGTLDHAVLSSKKALFRKIGNRNSKKEYASREVELKKELNTLNIGAMGLGGHCTVMDVFIETSPRHIATLPVAVSILCHSARRGEITI
ncbi:MAG: fumarate hydratase [bacterium]